MIWFTSDLHLGHANALKFAHRPWTGVERMGATLIDTINSHVLPHDELYILGDYSFKITMERAAALRRHIRCRNVHLVPGNHDKDWSQPDFAGTFIVEPPIVRLKVDGLKLVLSHYPIMDWRSMSHGSWHLHGHIHSRRIAGFASYNGLNRAQGIFRYDVGVDANGFVPVSLDELRRWFDGIEGTGRIRWWDWIDAIDSPEIAAECAKIRTAALEEES